MQGGRPNNALIFEYIETFYNGRRRQSALGYLSRVEHETVPLGEHRQHDQTEVLPGPGCCRTCGRRKRTRRPQSGGSCQIVARSSEMVPILLVGAPLSPSSAPAAAITTDVVTALTRPTGIRLIIHEPAASGSHPGGNESAGEVLDAATASFTESRVRDALEK